MTYLLDVSALIAWGVEEHSLRHRAVDWAQSVANRSVFATCSITELGFIRIVGQMPQYGGVQQAREMLHQLKRTDGLTFFFIADANGADVLPSWVRSPKQVTDGHLVRLARTNRAVLATFDKSIPGSFLIPEQ